MDHDQTNKQLVFHLNEYLNNETLSHRRRKNFAPKELNIIISMVEENADLIYNRVNKNPKFISKQEFWQTVTNVINENCHFAAQRDVKEVRRKWVTFQSEVKSKAREGTHLLNIHEKRVFDLIQLHSQISEGNISADQDRLTMLPNNRGMSGDLKFDPSGDLEIKGVSNTLNNSNTISNTSSEGVFEQISQSNSPASSHSSNPAQNSGVKIENVTDTELLMNICSQVMGLSPDEISAQVGGAISIKDIISKPVPVSKVTNHPLTSTVSPSVAPPIVTPIPLPVTSTPIRNVVSVQPVNHVQTPPKRARLDVTPTNNSSANGASNTFNGFSNTSNGVTTENHANGPGTTNSTNGSSSGSQDMIADLLREIVEQQRHANLIGEERLSVERQRRDLETEKLDIERARYEIEKERLCQEIISRKKS